MEVNKLVAAVLVAGLAFMAISVGVDEFWRENTLEATVYPVPGGAQPTGAVETGADEAVAEDIDPTVIELLAMADTAAGRKVAKKCSACHDLAEDGPNKAGPNLWGVVGAAVASHQGYAYSDALAGLGGDWSYEALDSFLTKPRAFAPGTKMRFAGIKKPGDRANLIAFLRTLSDNPMALPGE